MNQENFDRLKNLTDKELIIDINNVEEKTLSLPSTYQKYLKIYIVELKKLKALKTKVKWKYGKLYHYYRHEHEFSHEKKAEIEPAINANDEYYDMVMEMNDQSDVVEYLEKFLEQLKTAGFAVKSYIELLKLKHGMNV